jgi:hypothetical protein
MIFTKKTTETGYEYIEWDNNGVIRFIPIDPANSDYQAYLAEQSTPMVTDETAPL